MKRLILGIVLVGLIVEGSLLSYHPPKVLNAGRYLSNGNCELANGLTQYCGASGLTVPAYESNNVPMVKPTPSTASTPDPSTSPANPPDLTDSQPQAQPVTASTPPSLPPYTTDRTGGISVSSAP